MFNLDIAEAFNLHFANIAENLTKSTLYVKTYNIKDAEKSMSFSKATELEIEKLEDLEKKVLRQTTI